jgi:hypothetical protein
MKRSDWIADCGSSVAGVFPLLMPDALTLACCPNIGIRIDLHRLGLAAARSHAGWSRSFVPARGWTIFGFNPRAPFRSCRGHDKRRFCLLRLRPGRGDLDGGKLLTTRLRRRRRRGAWSRHLAGRGKRGSRCCRPGASLPGCGDVCAEAAAQSDEIRKDVEASNRGRDDLIGKLPSTHTN